MRGQARRLAAACTGLVLGLLALGPGLAPGFVLSYDMVFVPDPRFGAETFGLAGMMPRHVPSDAFVTALATVLPGDLAQKLILLSIFVMAVMSAASLVPSDRLAPGLAAGVCYAWNPFVAERLLLGHWALLLGYAALPWAIGAAGRVTEPGGGRRLVRALIPAGIGGFAALAVSGLAVLIVALVAAGRTGRARIGAVARTAAILLVFALPWLVPGLLWPGGVPADLAGVEAFAARADTPFGTLGSVLLLGGLWNSETVPTGYGAPVTAVAWLAVVVVALVSYVLWCRTAAAGALRWPVALVPAAVAGYAVAVMGAVAAPVLRALIDWWPGLSVLRDAQQYAAPLAVMVAVGFGTAVHRMSDAVSARVRDGVPALGALAVVVPLALLPSLAWGAAGRLDAVAYPDDWARARALIRADSQPGDVLVLPWAAHRSYSWNDGRRTLNPLSRYLTRHVIFNDAVTVGAVTIPTEQPRARELAPTIMDARSPGPPITARLRAAGIRYIAVDDADSGLAQGRLAGAERVLAGSTITVYRLVGEVPERSERHGMLLTVLAWFLLLGMILWSLRTRGITLS